MPTVSPTLPEFLTTFRTANPEFSGSDQDLTTYWNKTYAPKEPASAEPAALPTWDAFKETMHARLPETSESDLKSYWTKEYGSKGALEHLRSTPAEVGRQVVAGAVVDVPKMVGQAGRAISEAAYVGRPHAQEASALPYEVMEADAKLREVGWMPDLTGRSEISKAFVRGGRALAPSLATMAAYMNPGGAVTGPLATVALFGGSQYQDEYDKMKAAGASDDDARNAGLITGMIQGGGEVLANYLGLRALGLGRKVLGEGTKALLGKSVDTSVVKPWLKATGQAVVGEAATEAGQDVATAKVERSYGLETDSLSTIAFESGGAAAAMTLLLAPLGLHGHYRASKRAEAIDQILADPKKASPEDRAKVVQMLAAEGEDLKLPDAAAWKAQALQDVIAGRPIRREVMPPETADPAEKIMKQPTVDGAIAEASKALDDVTPDALDLAMSQQELPTESVAFKAPKLQYVGIQQGSGQTPAFELWTLLEPSGDLTQNSTYSRQTLEQAGIPVPTAPQAVSPETAALPPPVEPLQPTPVPPIGPPSLKTVEDIHALADQKGIPWDDDPDFMDLTQSVTGKRRLDHLTGPERQRVYDALITKPSIQPSRPSPSPALETSPSAAPRSQAAAESGTAFSPLVQAYLDRQKPEMRPYFEGKLKGFTPNAQIDQGGQILPVRVQSWIDKKTALVEMPARNVVKVENATVKLQRIPGQPLPQYQKEAPVQSDNPAVSQPRHELPAEQNENLAARADAAHELVAQGEPGKRVFTDNPNAPGQTVTGQSSTYPPFYGSLRMRKETVLKALEKIQKDQGLDVGPQVEKVKAALIDDATLDQIVGEFPGLADEVEAIQQGPPYLQPSGRKTPGQTSLLGDEPIPEQPTKAAKASQPSLPMDIPVEVGQRPIIGREVEQGSPDAPLFSNVAQTPEPQQFSIPADKLTPKERALRERGRTANKDNIDDLIARYESTGRVAYRYPRKRQISVDGRSMPEREAIAKMERVLAQAREAPPLAQAHIEPFISKMEVQGEGGEKRAAAGMDPRIMKVLGGNLYSGDLGKIAVKEMLQNAVDSVRGLPEGSQGSVRVEVDTKNRTILVTDTGIGMLPEVVSKELVDIGGSKKAEGSSGGFGIAKVAIFANAERIYVQTIAKGTDFESIQTTLTGTGDDWMDQAKGLTMKTTKDVGQMTGTMIEIRLRPEAQMTQFAMDDWLSNFLQVKRLPFQIEATIDGVRVKQGNWMTRDLPTAEKIGIVSFPGGTIDIYATSTQKDVSSVSVDVLNHGLPQFTDSFWLGMGSVKMPAQIIADFKATAGPEESHYPFSPDRERLRKEAKAVLETYVKDLAKSQMDAESRVLIDAINAAPAIPETSMKVIDTGGTTPKDFVQQLAKAPHIKTLSLALQKAFGDLQTALSLVSPEIAKVEFGGIGLGSTYLGANINGKGLGRETNLILVNPYTTLEEINRRVLDGTVSGDLATRRLAEQLTATLIHELSHQQARGHDEAFSGALTRNQGHVILESADVFRVILKTLELKLKAPGRRFLGRRYETVLDSIQRDLTTLKPTWREGADVFGKISTSHAEQRADRAGEGDLARSSAGRTEPAGDLRRRRPEPPGALASRPTVSTRGSDLVSYSSPQELLLEASSFVPAESVSKAGDHWRYTTIQGTEHPATYPTQTTAIEAAQRHQEAKLEAIRSEAFTRVIARREGEVVEPLLKPNARRKLSKALVDFEAGELTSHELAERVDEIQSSLELKRYEKLHGTPLRVRGDLLIRERILQAVRRGDLPREQLDLTEWFLKGNEHLVDRLGISVKVPVQGQAGSYDPLTRIMTLMKETERKDTAVHEILHHLERLMPTEYQEAIRKEWTKQITKKLGTAKGDEKAYLHAVLKANLTNELKDWTDAQDFINDGKVPYDLYNLMNASEFWAVNGTTILSKRHTGIWGQIKQWMREAVQRIKGFLGLDSQAPVLKALAWLQTESTGKELSKSMLAQARVYVPGAMEAADAVEVPLAQPSGLQDEPSQDEAATVQAGLEGKSVLDAGRFLAETGPSDHYRLIADKVVTQLTHLQKTGMGFELHIAHLHDQVPQGLVGTKGMTWLPAKSETTQIWLQGSDVTGLVGVSYETALHELIHGATQAAIEVGKQEKAHGTPLADATKDLYAVTNAVLRHFRQRLDESGGDPTKLTPFERELLPHRANPLNPFNDPGEVLAWTFTNRNMQQYLEAIPYQRQTLWSAFVQAIRRFLGLSAEAETALSEVLRVGEQLLDAPAYQIMTGVRDIWRPTQINQYDGFLNNQTSMLPAPDKSRQQPLYPKTLEADAKGGPARGIERMGKLTEDQHTALRHVHGTPEAWSEKLNAFKATWKSELIQGLFDHFAPILNYSKQGYLLARLSKSGDGTLEALLLYGKPYVDKEGAYKVEYDKKKDEKTGKVTSLNGFAKVLAGLQGEHDRFLEWVAAHRASRLKELGLENLYSDADIAALKNLSQGKMPDGMSRPQVYLKTLEQLNDWNLSILKIAMDSGLINRETMELYKHTPYVPFYRLQEDDTSPAFRMTPGMVNQYAWKKLKGGTAHLNDDLLANLLQNWSHLITASAKNRAARATLQAAVQAGVAEQVSDSGKGTVSYREGGKDLTFSIDDPALLEAVSALHYAGLGAISQPFTTMKRWLTFGVTVNPAFKIRNLLRDSLQVIATSDISYNPLKNIGQGWEATAKESETRAQMLAGGGMIRFGAMLDGTNADRTRRLIETGVKPEHILNNQQTLQRFWTSKVMPAFEAYQELGDRGEQVNRAALYEQLLEQGVSHAEASFLARDLMDFSLMGKWEAIRILTQVVPFMNARLQGIYKLGRAGKDDYKRMGTVLGAVSLASIALLLAYEDDEDWKKREDWDRDNFWWFKVGGVAFRLPKPFEIGAVGTIAERSIELFRSDEMTGGRFGERLRDIVFSQLNMNPTPQLLKPLMDLYANKDSFTGQPIETLGMDRMRKEDRATERTSELAKVFGQLGLPDPTQLAMGRWNTLSPVQIDALVHGYFSWLGSAVTTALDYGIRPIVNHGAKPAMRLKDVFLAGNFVETLPTNQSRYVTQLYEQAKEIEEAYGSYRDALAKGDREKAKTIREEEKDKIAKYPLAEAVKGQEAILSRQMRRVESDPKLSSDEKREQLDKLAQRKHEVAKRLGQRLVAP